MQRVRVSFYCGIILLLLFNPVYSLSVQKYKKKLLNEDNLRFLQVAVYEPGKHDIRQALKFETPIDAYYVNNKLYLPISQLFDVLEFAISVFPEKHIARGWFIKEDNSFSLDNFQVEVAGKKIVIDSDDIIFSDDIYIESTTLSKIFGMDFKPDLSESRLCVACDKPIPVQERKNREKKWNTLHTHGIDTTNFSKVKGTYRKFSMPFIDVSLNDSLSLKPSVSNLISYSLGMTNHMCMHMNQLFVSGSNEEISNISYIISKYDTDKSLLGPLHATSYHIGDIDSTSIALISGSTIGRGFTAKNTTLGDITDIEKTSFTGHQTPGWQVELYRNGELLEFSTIDSTGYWQFNDVPLLSGLNKFNLIFYGPHGEKREETRIVNTSASVLPKGKIEYNFSANEENKKLFDGLIKNQATNEQETFKFASVMKYGLHKHFSPIVGFVSDKLEGDIEGRQNYLMTGFVTSFLQPFIVESNYAYNATNRGNAFKVTALGNILNTNTSLEYLRLDDFVSDAFNTTNAIKDRSKIILNRRIKPLRLGASIKLQRTTYQDKTISTEISNILSTTIARVNISNILYYTKTQNTESSDSITKRGQLILGGFVPAIRSSVRGSIYYNLSPQTEISSYDLTFTKNLAENLSGTLDISKRNTKNDPVSYTASLIWDRRYYRLGLKAGGDTKKNFFIGASIDFSLVQDPHSKRWYMQRDNAGSSGAVSIRQFLDKNYNNKLDKGEEILPTMELLHPMYKNKQYMGSHSNLITNIPAHNEFHFEYNADQLEYDQTYENRGASVLVQPGAAYILDIPVMKISEIEGTAMISLGNGKLKPLYRAPVQLIDSVSKKVIKTFYSEFDGFYIFDKVKPGNYVVRIDPEYLKKRNLTHDKLHINVVEDQPKVFSEQDCVCSRPLTKFHSTSNILKNDSKTPKNVQMCIQESTAVDALSSLLKPRNQNYCERNIPLSDDFRIF